MFVGISVNPFAIQKRCVLVSAEKSLNAISIKYMLYHCKNTENGVKIQENKQKNIEIQFKL